MKAQPAHRGFVAALGLGQLLSWGTLYYSFPLIAEAIAKDMGWDRAAIYGAASLGLLAAALGAYPVGVLIDRGYGRAVMVGASLAACATLVLWSSIATIWALYAVVIVLGALQAALLYESAFAVTVHQLGSQHSRSAITSITLWAGFASMVFVPLVQIMIDAFGWRATVLGLAGVNAVIAAPLYLWAIQPGVAAAEPEVEIEKKSILPVLQSTGFWVLTAALCAYMAFFSAFSYHIYPLLISKGIDAHAVVFAIALIGPAQAGSRMLLVFLQDISIRRLGIVASLAFPVVAIMLMGPGSASIIIGLCVLYGGVNGVFTIVRGMAVPELLSSKNYGRLNGIMLVPMSLARAAAPWAIVAWDSNGWRYGAEYLLLWVAILVPVLFSLAVYCASSRVRPGLVH